MPDDIAPQTDPTANSAPDVGQPPAEPPVGEQTPAPGAESAAGEKPPETPQESAVTRALRARERDFIQKQLNWKRDREQAERDFDERVKKAVAEAVNKELSAFDEDPVGFSKKRGVDENKLAGRLLNQGKKTAEEVAAEAIARAERLEKQVRDKEQAEAKRSAERTFLEHIDKNGAKYPHIADEWEPHEVIEQTYRVIARLQQKGITDYTDDELAEYLDGQAKSRQARREERKQGRSAPAQAEQAPAGTTTSQGGSGAKAGSRPKTATATLSASMSAERQTVNGKDPLEMNDDEMRALIEREVAKAKAALGPKA